MQEVDVTAEPNRPNENPPKKPGRKAYWPYGVTATVLVVDQVVKFWAEQALGPVNSGKSIELLGGQIRLIYIKNSGASFGILKDAPWLFTILAIVASVGIIFWYQTQGTEDKWYRLGMGLILGGIVGNLADRLFKGGSVTDMINFPNIELFRIFNVADSAITIGVVTILLRTLIVTLQQSKEAKAEKAANEHKGSEN